MTERHLNYIAGEWQPARSGATFEDRNPADERDLIGLFPDSDAADVADAVASVAPAWPAWAAQSPEVRADVLFKAADLMAQRADAIAAELTREEGKTLTEARNEARRIAANFRLYAGEALRLNGETYPSDSGQIGAFGAPAGRRGRRHHAVELSAVDGRAQARPGACRRQWRRLQALRNHAADGPAPRRGAARCRPAAQARRARAGQGRQGRPGDHARARRRRADLHRLLSASASRSPPRFPPTRASSSRWAARTPPWSSPTPASTRPVPSSSAAPSA